MTSDGDARIAMDFEPLARDVNRASRMPPPPLSSHVHCQLVIPFHKTLHFPISFILFATEASRSTQLTARRAHPTPTPTPPFVLRAADPTVRAAMGRRTSRAKRDSATHTTTNPGSCAAALEEAAALARAEAGASSNDEDDSAAEDYIANVQQVCC